MELEKHRTPLLLTWGGNWSQGNGGALCRQALTGLGSQPGGGEQGLGPTPGAETVAVQEGPGSTRTLSPVPLCWVFTDVFFGVPYPVLEDKSYSRESERATGNYPPNHWDPKSSPPPVSLFSLDSVEIGSRCSFHLRSSRVRSASLWHTWPVSV